MISRPKVFISTVSKELGSSRQLLANTLQFMGYDPDWQDIFETEQGDLRAMLRRRIDESQGVIHLVGHCYGAEPPVPDDKFGRVSYTQYEALYARQCGKRVWTFVLNEDYPVDTYEPESGELQALQSAYRDRVKAGGDLYYPLSSQDALEAGTLKLRSELTALRRGFRRWAIAVSAVLLATLSVSVWLLMQQGKTTATIADTARTSEQTATVARKTADIASHTARTTEQTAEVVGQTHQVVEQTHTTMAQMDSRENLDSASARLQRAIDAMNLSNQGQVGALELLLANGYGYVNSRFDGVWLHGADLRSRNFGSTSFEDADLTDVKLEGADLTDATAFLATADRLDATGAKALQFRLQMAQADHARFDHADLTQASFYFSRMRGSSFRGANCTAVNFAYADLTGADFTGADLTGAQFIGAVLEGATFDKATFKSTDMSGALAGQIEVTDAQRAGMRRSIGFENNHYLTVTLVRKTPSNKYDSGYTFHDEFRAEFIGVLGRVPGTLRIRRADTPKPVGFTAAWHPDTTSPWRVSEPAAEFALDTAFLDIGDRIRRIRQRIDEHGQFLIAATRRLQPIEGDGSEFAAWLVKLQQNTSNAEPAGLLRLNDEERLIVALWAGAMKPDDLPDWRWAALANTRYEREWPSRPDPDRPDVDPNAPDVDGWPRFYPPSGHDLSELPPIHAQYYREWTANRAKSVNQPRLDIQMDIYEPRHNGGPRKPGPLDLFVQAVENSDRYGGSWKPPEDLPNGDQLFQVDHRFVLRLEKPRSAFTLPVDEPMTYPIHARVQALAVGYERSPIPGQNDTFHEIVRLRPVSAALTGSDGKSWQGAFEIATTAPGKD